jgi:hypothetical protein
MSDNLAADLVMESVVSSRSNGPQTQLWWVRPIDKDLGIDETKGHVFAGDATAMVKHINELHRQTGIRQAAQSVES